MGKRLRLPGPRELRATLDGGTAAQQCVVACPPHPQMGGDRRDGRLRTISDALVEIEIACLRIDYGPWDDGAGEQTDVQTALSWAREEFETVGLFGYSFGASIALLATAAMEWQPAAVSVLAPEAKLTGEFDAAAAVDDITCPLQIVYGERDDTVDWKTVVERASATGHTVEAVPGDHFFVGQQQQVANLVSSFFAAQI